MLSLPVMSNKAGDSCREFVGDGENNDQLLEIPKFAHVDCFLQFRREDSSSLIWE